MRYAFLIYLDEATAEARPQAVVKAAMAAHTPYIELLRKNGKYVDSQVLAAARTAFTVRTAAGKPLVTDGPFAESHEQLGGFYIVEAADLDDAIELATLCPAWKTVGVGLEIRPVAGGGVDAGAAYLLAVYGPEPDELGHAAGWAAAIEHVRATGRFAGAGLLAQPGSATTLRLRDGNVVLSDGPFADGRDQLWGYCALRDCDRDEAVRGATAWSTVEIRAIRAT